jgi:hypothetical protein
MASVKQRKAKAKRVAHHNRSKGQVISVTAKITTYQSMPTVYPARGECPVCGKREKLRKDGTLTAHGSILARCAGSGRPL